MVILSISDAFIKRPVLSTVCTLLILLAGAIAIPLLPINSLPDIAPIQIITSGTYIGADAETVEETVTTPVERQVNGVEKMAYISSTSSNDGASSVSTYFETGTDRNINQVNVQNRAAIAQPTLPDAVRQTGVTTLSRSTSILQVYGFFSENKEYDSTFISNYVDLYVIDPLKRIPGVGDVRVVGERQYAMRLWLDPNALASRGLTTTDVANALTSQNVQVGAGAVGQAPAPDDQAYTFTLRVDSRLKDVTEFENLVLKSQSDGALVKLKDIGRAELGARDYTTSALIRGKPGVALLLYQLPGSNALEVAKALEEAMAGLEKNFPPGLKYVINYDTTPYIEVSIEDVFNTLIIAIVLVILVIFVFLQNWRTTIVPVIAIPVSLIGALAFALAFKFSLNNLTMFGLVLATGLVVDDAIIVVENITAKMEQGLNARQASVEAMQELSGAVVATSLVLMAVFIPVSFLPGSTGIMYRQFALIIAFAIAISTFNALTFTPSISAILLRQTDSEGRGPLAWFFRKFNRGFGWVIDRYRSLVNRLIRVRMLVVGVFVLGLAATVMVYTSVPSGFVPDEDQGLFLGIIQAPDGVPLSYTEKVAATVSDTLSQMPEVETYVLIPGFGLNGSGPNQGAFFVRLKPWEERHGQEHSVATIVGRLNQEVGKNQEAIISAFNLPAVPGFSSTGGFELQLLDKSVGKLSIDDFAATAQQIIAKANQNPVLQRVFTQFTTGTPQIQIDLDRDKLEALNVDYGQAVSTLGAFMGGRYVNDFTFAQRNYRVYVQADAKYRSSPDDVRQIQVRSRDNKLVRLSEIATLKQISGPQVISHFNLFRTIKIQGSPAPGRSSGEAIAAMQQAFTEVTQGQSDLDYAWTGLALEQLKSGGQTLLIFGLSIVVVFLVLAAQYENYVDPLIILLTVPLAILGAMSFVALRGLQNDVYCQIALVMLIGLASKNAILIVEFANQSREEGMSIVQAAKHASEQRFRPILMTASASLVGFFPLVVASGAGSASRWSLGTAVFGGLLVATILSFLLVPVLYVVIKSLYESISSRRRRDPHDPPTPPTSSEREFATHNSGAESRLTSPSGGSRSTERSSFSDDSATSEQHPKPNFLEDGSV
ncbi:MAG: efflux RND transporter permease subunit [Myxacorys chilensis ATA2-1-KO14]|jgi:HAE1 family hydrophobic/amphiphilic exporter-1|nr:efflux RND transporter permease subunit [Myxacorys chilensis ATA2-1-KO14]